jgi:hypothetical protein
METITITNPKSLVVVVPQALFRASMLGMGLARLQGSEALRLDSARTAATRFAGTGQRGLRPQVS